MNNLEKAHQVPTGRIIAAMPRTNTVNRYELLGHEAQTFRNRFQHNFFWVHRLHQSAYRNKRSAREQTDQCV